MKTTLTAADVERATRPLAEVDRRFAERFPGESGERQPVHTVYGGAQLFEARTARKLGELALRALHDHAGDGATLARALGIEDARPDELFERVRSKLEREPVEDYRIDYEDGYGVRPDAEEDAHAVNGGNEIARGIAAGVLPPYFGIRIKPFNAELRARSIRTLDLFLTELVERAGGAFPERLLVTLPKVVDAEQVASLAALLTAFERASGLRERAIRIELMVELPQAIVGADGRNPLPAFFAAASGRCTGAHFGTYDYTAGLGITAAHQHMLHPVCDFAKHAMQAACAGTGIRISDGATNVMPVPLHRRREGDPSLGARELRENREAVHRAWRLHAEHVRHSLIGGFYQGWDLHPAQLVSRYAALFAFFRESLDAAGQRLRNFVEKAAQATLVGEVFDDAATGQGLLNYFLRAVECGALPEEEAVARSGLSLDELAGRSFVRILARRRAVDGRAR
jgi:citrate lyase beta subunit